MADELRKICGESRSTKVVATIPTEARPKVREAPKATRETLQRTLDVEESSAGGNAGEELRKLPYVKGHLSWKVVEGIAKNVNKTTIVSCV